MTIELLSGLIIGAFVVMFLIVLAWDIYSKRSKR